jgi:hypothetical protein
MSDEPLVRCEVCGRWTKIPPEVGCDECYGMHDACQRCRIKAVRLGLKRPSGDWVVCPRKELISEEKT